MIVEGRRTTKEMRMNRDPPTLYHPTPFFFHHILLDLHYHSQLSAPLYLTHTSHYRTHYLTYPPQGISPCDTYSCHRHHTNLTNLFLCSTPCTFPTPPILLHTHLKLPTHATPHTHATSHLTLMLPHHSPLPS